MPHTVDYERLIRWMSSENDYVWFPQCMVRIHSPSGRPAQDCLGILDTGANDLILPQDVARTLGINIAECDLTRVSVASGNVVPMRQTDLDATIKGLRIRVRALFGPNNCPVLIGLYPIIEAMKFGIIRQGWLYGRP